MDGQSIRRHAHLHGHAENFVELVAAGSGRPPRAEVTRGETRRFAAPTIFPHPAAAKNLRGTRFETPSANCSIRQGLQHRAQMRPAVFQSQQFVDQQLRAGAIHTAVRAGQLPVGWPAQLFKRQRRFILQDPPRVGERVKAVGGGDGAADRQARSPFWPAMTR